MRSVRRSAAGLGLSLAILLGGLGSHWSTQAGAPPEALDVEPIATVQWWWPWPTTTRPPATTTTTVAPTTTRATTTTTRAPVTTTTARATTTTTAPTTTTAAPTTTAPTTTAPTAAPGSVTPTMAGELLQLVNAKRASGTTCGGAAYPRVAQLTLNDLVARAAAGHASDMATRNYFSHTGLDGSTPGTRLTAVGYRWRAYGENIAAGQATPTSVVTAWFNSAGHCANFMSPNVTHIGFGRAVSSTSRYGTYWVADLARPA